MLQIPDAPVFGATPAVGVRVPGAALFGSEPEVRSNFIFLQNDSSTNPATPWYVKKITDTKYAMTNATAPKGSQYIGAFIWDVATGKVVSRLDRTAVWTTSDESVVKIDSITSTGQAVITIAKAGTVMLTVSWRWLSAELTIASH